ncbi:DUF3888 domain-containing protein [Clostridium magnum]|uniref:DUF3888 domain-containing protein n=1 Tax=Clostridium magnum DSM 2767 TaxID=1121326 RepID=A0A162ST98_9CLOT|nr:DUF3888 domain-containing protein [Clostridium magnum]KZL91840.1 hypothetical protein CLMAG_16460 [Clostridium magnum DSM 2767]SHI25642.1 Protein of unknown function [Clostridium magnum DSM 2767]
MRKKLVIIFTIILFTIAFTNRFCSTTYANDKNTFFNAVNINQDESQEKLENDLLLSVFTPYISKAIENYYGELRQFDLWDAKIISIKRLEPGTFNFETMISVATFKGPHNPPYGLEMVTIRFDDTGIHVVNFKHKDVSFYD